MVGMSAKQTDSFMFRRQEHREARDRLVRNYFSPPPNFLEDLHAFWSEDTRSQKSRCAHEYCIPRRRYLVHFFVYDALSDSGDSIVGNMHAWGFGSKKKALLAICRGYSRKRKGGLQRLVRMSLVSSSP